MSKGVKTPNVTILENGEAMDVTNDRAMALQAQGKVYRCPDCGPTIFHLCDGVTFKEIEG